MKKTIMAALALGFSSVASAQDAQSPMMSEGQHFALRHVEPMTDGSSLSGTFAYRMRPDSNFAPNEWVTITSYTCEKLNQTGIEHAAFEIINSLNRDVHVDTGVMPWDLHLDGLSAMRALKRHCDALVS